MSAIDKDTFDKLKARMKAKFPVLLEGYLNDAKSYIVTIDTNILPGGELSQIVEAAHSLKSASGLLGITDVHAEAEKVEYTGKAQIDSGQNNIAAVQPHVEHLKNAFSAVESDLKIELEKAKNTLS